MRRLIQRDDVSANSLALLYAFFGGGVVRMLKSTRPKMVRYEKRVLIFDISATQGELLGRR